MGLHFAKKKSIVPDFGKICDTTPELCDVKVIKIEN
jgi:hypothetical protein